MKIVDVLKQSVSCAKRMSVWALALSGLFAPSVGAVTITSVAAQQRLSSNGLVDITVTFGGTASDVAKANCTFAATDSATKTALPVLHVTRNGNDSGSGNVWTRRFVWDTLADVGGTRIDDVELVVELDGLGGVQLWEGGPYWAECNVGASKPEEYGLYFWWGDTVGHAGSSNCFNPTNCPTYGKNGSELRSLGYVDSAGNLTPAHDAARKHLGAPWRMPTAAEFDAMINTCTTRWITRSGVNGWLVMGTGAYSSKNIFIPAAGFVDDTDIKWAGSRGGCRSSTPKHNDSEKYAHYLYFTEYIFMVSPMEFRSDGLSVRPVREFAAASTASTHLMLNCDDFDFVVHFNANDGTPSDPYSQRRIYPATGEMPDQEFSYGVAQNLDKCAFTRAGYTFSGWSRYSNSSVLHKDGASIKLSKSDTSFDTYELYAVWNPKTITVTFDYQGWNGNRNDSCTCTVGSKYSSWHYVDSTDCNIDGWYKANGEKVESGDYVPTENTTLYLHWQRKEYTVKFDPNGGSGKMASKKFQYGIATALPLNQFVCSGCQFKGWSTTAGGEVEFTDGQQIKKIKSMAGLSSLTVRLYAVWEPVARPVKVVFDPMGGTADYTEWTYEIGSAYGMLPTATYSGHTFDGWYTAVSGGTKVTASTVVSSSVTRLYAHWIPTPYTIKFKPDTGSGTMSSMSCAPDKVYTLTRCSFKNTGTAFKGWACSNGRRYDDGMLVFNLAKPGETVTMTAIWEDGVQLWENGPYWATCNVGATKPEECGYYFWWGDTVGYTRNANNDGWISVKDGASYQFNDCPTSFKNDSQLQSEGYIDSTGNLVAKYDAATTHLGVPWRMPTAAEIDALASNCDTIWTMRNDVYGRLVRGRGAYASKSIFLPAAGFGSDSDLDNLGSFGYYWSSTPPSNWPGHAYFLCFGWNEFGWAYFYSRWGRSVRPVRGFSK